MKKRSFGILLALAMVVTAIFGATPAFAAKTVYAPIESIETSYPGSSVQFVESQPNDRNAGTYVFHMPGAEKEDLANVDLTFNAEAEYKFNIYVILDAKMGEIRKGTPSVTLSGVDLSKSSYSFSMRWGTNVQNVVGAAPYSIIIDTSEDIVDVQSVKLGGVVAELEETTVGGVTRYNYGATLPTSADLTAVPVEVKVPTGAVAELFKDGKSIPGNENKDTYTFANVSFKGAAVTLKITNGHLVREYSLFAHKDGTVTVEIALRTYAVEDWLNGYASWGRDANGNERGYDYVNEGFGEGMSLSGVEKQELLDAAEALSAYTGCDNEREYVEFTVEGEIYTIPVFTTYVEMEIEAGISVMEALDKFCQDYGVDADIGYGGNYLHSIGVPGYRALGEMECGWASGWIYTVKPEGAPRAIEPAFGAGTYPLAGGEQIDWIYICAMGMDSGFPYGM